MSVNSIAGATGSPFRDYCSKVLEDLCREHDREVAAMYNDNLNIRKELSRVADLLTSSLEREKELHKVSDMLQSVFHHIPALGQAANQASSNHAGRKSQLVDPLQATQQELSRIQQILSSPPVPPPSMSSRGGGFAAAPLGGGNANYNAMSWSAPAATYTAPVSVMSSPPMANGGLFSMLDRNGDGMISRSEFAQFSGPQVVQTASPQASYVASPVASYVPAAQQVTYVSSPVQSHVPQTATQYVQAFPTAYTGAAVQY